MISKHKEIYELHNSLLLLFPWSIIAIIMIAFTFCFIQHSKQEYLRFSLLEIRLFVFDNFHCELLWSNTAFNNLPECTLSQDVFDQIIPENQR